MSRVNCLFTTCTDLCIHVYVGVGELYQACVARPTLYMLVIQRTP